MVKKGVEIIIGKVGGKPEDQWSWIRAGTFHP